MIDEDGRTGDTRAGSLLIEALRFDLDEGAHDIDAQASAAWEGAVCWDDEHAIKRLAEVRAV